MKNKKQIFTTLFSVLISVFLISAVAYATTTVGNDVTVGNNLTINGATTTFADTATLSSGNINGTTLTSLFITPKASVATGSINYQKLVTIGDVTGTTAFGFGDVAKPTTGLMVSFGRTIAATSPITDTSFDIRAINKLDNSGTSYDLQGAYIKAKNYSTGKLRNLKGLSIETINDSGIISGSSHALYFGTDGTTITDAVNMSSVLAAYGIDMNGATFGTADIRLKNGETISNSPDGTIAFGSANLTNTGNITVTSGIVSAPAYQIGSGAPFTATDTPTPTQVLLQQASFWPVIISSGDIDINLPAMTTGDIGRHLTFAVTTSGAHAFTVTSGATTVINILSNAGIVAGDDAGDYIDCLITTATTATCVTYATD